MAALPFRRAKSAKLTARSAGARSFHLAAICLPFIAVSYAVVMRRAAFENGAPGLMHDPKKHYSQNDEPKGAPDGCNDHSGRIDPHLKYIASLQRRIDEDLQDERSSFIQQERDDERQAHTCQPLVAKITGNCPVE